MTLKKGHCGGHPSRNVRDNNNSTATDRHMLLHVVWMANYQTAFLGPDWTAHENINC